ncbi:hypothetical protein, partial [Endozoicomonas sp. ONNA2]|uniref:hypothetical protein n=1 Tax=Endozoicomonas sp. ONNA2 TaxID=2828741 RepID=UPI0021490917
KANIKSQVLTVLYTPVVTCSCLQTRSALLANKGSFVPELTENKALLMLTLSENMPELSDNSLKTARPAHIK